MRDYMFGNYLRELRELSGLSQYALGRLIGVSDKAVSKWENGVSRPQSRTLGKLCRALGVTVDELLSGERVGSSEKTEVSKMRKRRGELWACAYAKMDELFGGKPPVWAVDRLERERAEIENTDMLVEFDMLAQLVRTVRAAGCRVRTPGHTGAFYAAYLLGATDIDPLPPHYRCPECGYSELADADCDCLDLPKRVCVCGHELRRSGHGIMFESYRHVIGRPGRIGADVPGSFLPEAERFVTEHYGGRAVKVGRAGRQWRSMYVILPETHPRVGAESVTYEEYVKIRDELPTVMIAASEMLGLIRRLEAETAMSAERLDIASCEVVDAFFCGSTDGIDGFEGAFMRELLKHTEKSVNGLVRAAGLAHMSNIMPELGCCADDRQRAEATARIKFAYRDDVFAYLRGRCGDGVAYSVMNDAFRGVFAKHGMDERTKRLLAGAGVDGTTVAELESTAYLFPRVQGVAAVRIALTLMWYKLNRPDAFADALAANRGE